MDPVTVLTIATLVIGPVIAIMWGFRGILIGAAVIWVLPVIARVLFLGGVAEYGGIGGLVHIVLGGPFGFAWCGFAWWLYQVITILRKHALSHLAHKSPEDGKARDGDARHLDDVRSSTQTPETKGKSPTCENQ